MQESIKLTGHAILKRLEPPDKETQLEQQEALEKGN
jgi:hypothetical protein